MLRKIGRSSRRARARAVLLPLPPAAAASAGLSGAVGSNAGALPPGGAISGLTGVRLGSRPQALIDGQWFTPGAQVRGARLLAIQADAVLLQPPDGAAQRLALTPQVELRHVSTPPHATAAARAVRLPQARSP